MHLVFVLFGKKTEDTLEIQQGMILKNVRKIQR